MRFLVKELLYKTSPGGFIRSLEPYEHQRKTLELIRNAIQKKQSLCIENISVTGSGKTLATFAAAILDGTRTIGMYPTNELLDDQLIALLDHMHDLRPFDSQGLDEVVQSIPDIRNHAQALAWGTGHDLPTAILTNPDVLYLAMFNLYGNMFTTFAKAAGSYTFQHIINNYPVLAFDEFHLYSPPQIASIAFLMGAAREMVEEKPHIFVFSSATPQNQFRHYAERLNLEVVTVESTPSDVGRVVCEEVEINLLPANLIHWQGGETIISIWDEILEWADSCTPQASGVIILDGVFEAKRLAQELRKKYGTSNVGEVHGYMAKGDRAGMLHRRFCVGTTTIDVGVDFTNQKKKEFLIAEARTPAQAIQRIGRIGRNGRNKDHISVPNRVWLLIPAYAYEYIKNHAAHKATVTREELTALFMAAYFGHEDFSAYTRKYSPLEAVAAAERIKKLYHEDTHHIVGQRLQSLVSKLYEPIQPLTIEATQKQYDLYLKRQYAIWNKYGTPIKDSKQKYLSDLESFRNGMESDFSVVVYDKNDLALGFNPIRIYDLTRLLRRVKGYEVSKSDFSALIKENHPQLAQEYLALLEKQHGLLGYIIVEEILSGKALKIAFSIGERELEENGYGGKDRIIRTRGWDINSGEIQFRKGKESIRHQLENKDMNCLVMETKAFSLQQILRLPPLFSLHTLHISKIGASFREGSIAFGKDAFLLESIQKSWMQSSKPNDAMIF